MNWPEEKPKVKPHMHGWLAEGNKRQLRQLIRKHRPHTIIEVGSWYGMSAMFFAKESKAKIVCIDMWDEQFIKTMWENRGKNYKDHVPFIDQYPLYETFLVNLWAHRQRLTPIKGDSVNGLKAASELIGSDGSRVLVYIDAGHEYENVLADIKEATQLFPKAIICGDDWKWPEVQKAVQDYARENKRQITSYQNFWQFK